MSADVDNLAQLARSAIVSVDKLCPALWEACISAVSGQGTEILGFSRHLSVGDRVEVHGRRGTSSAAEIVAVRGDTAHAMLFSPIDGLGVGGRVTAPIHKASAGLSVSNGWLGRVVDPLGHPLDRGPPLTRGPRPRPVRAPPPDATRRARLGERVSLGIRALDLFVTCRHGQRIGLFAGSGVGKSSLLAMLARNASCDVSVIALVGERGREVREFIEDELGADALARSIVVVATSDASPLLRREAAYAAMTIAEYFRDRGKSVLLLMDSVTRFCHALREIALAIGEPPASRGYPPSVFAELPRLLERAGPGLQEQAPTGLITAFLTVLVEGDDLNEPVADSTRGLLDGHVILDRRIAERGRFPAIDVLGSVSRTVPGVNALAEDQLASSARGLLATYQDVADLVRLGAYRAGTDPNVDKALSAVPLIEDLLRQPRHERTHLVEAFAKLKLLVQ